MKREAREGVRYACMEDRRERQRVYVTVVASGMCDEEGRGGREGWQEGKRRQVKWAGTGGGS